MVGKPMLRCETLDPIGNAGAGELCRAPRSGRVRRSACLRFGLSLLMLPFALSSCSPQPQPVAADDRPNILLIVADDLGYADLGAFGSDIRTPNIDALAGEGMLFTQFHTAPTCAPTRVMLLSGSNNHVAGMGRQSPAEPLFPEVPGYEGHLSDRVAPFPRLLREAGYNTYIAGKWHQEVTPAYNTQSAGFDRSFINSHGGGNQFSSLGYAEGVPIYREDDVVVDYPDGRYATDLYTERLIEFIESGRGDGKPFFAYAAYTSPHWPLQVPDEELDRYRGHYDEGYDVLRERRFESLKEAGIIPLSSNLPPRNDAIIPWDELDAETQRHEARKMEIYAAMVENLDGHVGRLIEYLKSNDMYDDTLIVFMSDNGAAGEDFFNSGGYVSYLQENFDNSYENMGTATSWVSYGAPWAEAGSAPFSRLKSTTREGGLVAPMIIAGSGVAVHGAINTSYLTVMDLAPTFLELGGGEYPTDGSVSPMLGESMGGVLSGEATFVHDDDYVTVLFHWNHAALRQGKWKLVNSVLPFSASNFELFDMEADPGETTNLAEVEPEKYESLLALWRTKRRELGIILPGDL